MAISKIETNSLGSTSVVHSDTTLALQTNGTTTAITIDASQKVGIGTASPTQKLQVNTASGESAINITSVDTAGVQQSIYFGATGFNRSAIKSLNANTYDGNLQFFTGNASNFAERMRIDSSGNLLVGTTSTTLAGSGQFFSSNGRWTTSTGSGGIYALFQNSGGTEIGRINNNGNSSTTYSTSSDYRLKENIEPMIGALDKVAALKPVTYKWKSTGEESQGFIAHELAEVCPDAVVGEKDAIDEDGKPVYQGIDTSFLVATLTAAIQELNAKVTELEAKLASK